MFAIAIHAGGDDLDKIHVDDGFGDTAASAIKIDSGDSNRIKPVATASTDLNLGASGTGSVNVNSPLVVGVSGTPKGMVVFGDSSFNDEAGPYPLEVWPNMKNHTRLTPTPYPAASPTPYPMATPTPYPGTEIYPTPYPTGAPTAYPTAAPTAYPTVTPAISAADMTTPLFFVNTGVQDDHKIQNAVEAWGAFESYWTADFWGQKPPPERDSRFPVTGHSHGAYRAMNLWPLSQERSEQVMNINRALKTSYAIVRSPEDRVTIGGNVVSYPALDPHGHLKMGHMDDAAFLWGNLHIWRAHHKYHQYNDHTEVVFFRDDYKLRRSTTPYNPAAGSYPHGQTEGGDLHTLYPWIDHELGQPQQAFVNGQSVGEPLEDKEIVAVTHYGAKLHGPAPEAVSGDLAAMMVLADGKHDWISYVDDGTTRVVGSSPGQILFLTRPPREAMVPETTMNFPLLPALAIRAKGEVVLGFQTFTGADDTPETDPPDQKLPDHVGNLAYSLEYPQDRLHVHNNYVGEPSAVRFTVMESPYIGYPKGPDEAIGFRVGLSGEKQGLVWNFEETDLLFATGDTFRMKIGAEGGLGIGIDASDPIDGALDVVGDIYGSANAAFGGQLAVSGLADVATLAVGDTAEIGGSLEVGNYTDTLSPGDLGVTGDATVAGSASFGENVTVTGQILSPTAIGIGTGSPGAELEVRHEASGEHLLVDANYPDSNYVALRSPASHMLLESGGRIDFEVLDIYDNYRFDDGQGVATLFLENLQNSVGIGGTETPQAHLHVHDGATDHAAWMMFTNDTTGDDAFSAGFHVGLDASENGSLWSYEEASILFGTDNTNALRIDEDQNVILGSTSVSASSGVSRVLVFEAVPTPTPSAGTNGVQLYAQDESGTAELRVLDEIGNITTLSSHNRELLADPPAEVAIPWTSYQRNAYLGVEQNVDMAAVVRAVEELSGETFLHSRQLPPEERMDWVADQLAQKERVEAARVATCMEQEIEIAKTEALVPVPATIKVPRTVVETFYELNMTTGEVVPVFKDRIVYDEVQTGGQGFAFAEGARFDEKTGTFHRRKTEDECRIEIEPCQTRTPPDWMAERM